MRRQAGGLPFDKADMFCSLCGEGILAVKVRHIRNRFEYMHRILQKREHISRKDLDPVFIGEVRGNLPVIKAVLAQLDDLFCKLFFRAAAERGVPALAPEKIVKKT